MTDTQNSSKVETLEDKFLVSFLVKSFFLLFKIFFGLIEQSGSQITTVQHAQLNEWRTFSTSLKLCLVTWSMRRHKTPQN